MNKAKIDLKYIIIVNSTSVCDPNPLGAKIKAMLWLFKKADNKEEQVLVYFLKPRRERERPPRDR